MLRSTCPILILCVALGAAGGCQSIASFRGGDAAEVDLPAPRDAHDEPPLVGDVRPPDDDSAPPPPPPGLDATQPVPDVNIDCGTGDIDGDNVADFNDLAFARNCLSDTPSGSCLMADVNFDGKVTLIDVAEVQRRLHACLGSPCGGNFTIETIYSGKMVLCRLPQEQRTQCEANANLCNPAAGWSLCTATQFLAGGGANRPAGGGAWLASCVRDAKLLVSAPSDTPCGTCVFVNQAPAAVVGTRCDATVVTSMQVNLGVAAAPTCGTVGKGLDIAFWATRPAGQLLDAAVCCRQ
ncbi:MAG: hypothetical protein KC503_13700 [Myxococcales bacterium]|nr:hypothetical protein [Myxococcales bacterium]